MHIVWCGVPLVKHYIATETTNDQINGSCIDPLTCLKPALRSHQSTYIYPLTLQSLPCAFHHSTSVPVNSQKANNLFHLNLFESIGNWNSERGFSDSQPHQSQTNISLDPQRTSTPKPCLAQSSLASSYLSPHIHLHLHSSLYLKV